MRGWEARLGGEAGVCGDYKGAHFSSPNPTHAANGTKRTTKSPRKRGEWRACVVEGSNRFESRARTEGGGLAVECDEAKQSRHRQRRRQCQRWPRQRGWGEAARGHRLG